MVRRIARGPAAALLLCAGLAAAPPVTRKLTILHVNDIHARLLPDSFQQGGFATLAAVIDRELAGCTSCLVLNAGDLVQGTPVSTIFNGVPIFELSSYLRFDVATLGNHDLDYGWQQTRVFERIAQYPLVSANLVDAEGRLLTKAPYVIKTVNGIRVAVIGAMLTRLRENSTAERLGPYHVTPVLKTVRHYAREVRGKADLIVVLGHLDRQDHDTILRKAPEIPILVTGHDHLGMVAAEQYKGRINVRVKGYGVEVGRLDMEVNLRKKKPANWTWRRIPVDGNIVPPLPVLASGVALWEKRVSEQVDIPIGEARRSFSRAELKLVVERALKQQTGAHVAFVNAGGIRDELQKGRILARHVWNIFPFDNYVVMGYIKGERIKMFETPTFKLDSDRDYLVAMPDFVAENQKSQLKTEGLKFPIKGKLVRDVVIDWIKTRLVLD